jgi:hypothetical protein
MLKKINLIFLLVIIVCVAIFSEKLNAQSKFNVYDNQQSYGVENSTENILLILDCSGSMSETMGGRVKINAAKDVINKVLTQIPNDRNVGLRVYGHKNDLLKSIVGFSDCKASELLVPIGINNRSRISQALSRLNPVGMTPICYSLDQSVKFDFTGMPGKKRIILVSDGMETCNGSPCNFAVDLVKRNPDVTIDVIGLDLASNPSAQKHLKCAALVTHGKFYTADSPDEFLKSLQRSFGVSKDVQGVILKPKQ